MTNSEFSNEFDILYNNIASNQAPGVSEYEKSVFLTTAQDAIILELINGKNAFGDSFEKTEEIRRYLNSLVSTKELSVVDNQDVIKISDKSILFEIPEDLWFITHETVHFNDSRICETSLRGIEVVPVTQDEFHRIAKNPFRSSNMRRVLRLDIASMIELVSEYNIDKYIIRYISKLEPIILEDLPEGLSIKEKSEETSCKVDSTLHKAILERAVQIAKSTMGLYESNRNQ